MNRSRKAALALLGLWTGLNALVAVYVTVATLAGRPPPALALLMTERQIRAVDPMAVAVVNAQAVIANPLIVAVCALVMVVAWQGLRAAGRWALWSIAGVLVPVQVFGFVSDGFLGGNNVVANAVSSVLLAVALLFAERATRVAAARP
jgi:hypothetical protein